MKDALKVFECHDKSEYRTVKLVIKIGGSSLNDACLLRKFANALAQLLAEGHRVTVVHGGDGMVRRTLAGTNGDTYANGEKHSNSGEANDLPLMVLGGRISKTLVATLGFARISAFGLCGADGNIVRIRKTPRASALNFAAEVASVDPLWLEAISRNGGVPVIASIGVGTDGQYYCLDADQLAGACAIGWNSDALVFLTKADGPRNADGSVMRWLEAEKIVDLIRHSAVNPATLSKINACHEALKHGVKRTRILPLSGVDSLASFYFSRIDFGTEVILAV